MHFCIYIPSTSLECGYMCTFSHVTPMYYHNAVHCYQLTEWLGTWLLLSAYCKMRFYNLCSLAHKRQLPYLPLGWKRKTKANKPGWPLQPIMSPLLILSVTFKNSSSEEYCLQHVSQFVMSNHSLNKKLYFLEWIPEAEIRFKNWSNYFTATLPHLLYNKCANEIVDVSGAYIF